MGLDVHIGPPEVPGAVDVEPQGVDPAGPGGDGAPLPEPGEPDS
jgi:hypothetical protein